MRILWTALAGRHPRRLPVAAVVALLAVAGTAARAQTVCDEALRQGQKSYDLGLFEDVPGLLAPCLAANPTRAMAIQVRSLLARTYLAADDLKKAHDEVSAILRLDSDFEPAPPPRFAELVAQVRKEEQTVQVASVSKTKESLREAPATVIVITGEEIARRGYLDLEQVLHDLPGFDISRTNGDIYSNIYQRGFFTLYSDRNLLLLDGVEQNDLGTNVLYLSRQYPLSSIDRIEVVYGPASTMYGANAYTGVINILTKEPESLIAENKRLGLTMQATTGSLDAHLFDFSLTGKDRSGNVAWLLDGHLHRGNEMDLSSFNNWSFNYDAVNYKDALRLSGDAASAFNQIHPCTGPASPYYVCRFGSNGSLTSVELTDEGERRARELDRGFIQDNKVHFADQADDWSVHGKMRISNLTVGVDLWRTAEGIASGFSDLFIDGFSHSAIRETSFYLKYSRPVGQDLTFQVFTRYLQSEIDKAGSPLRILHLYANSTLGISNLVPPCSAPGDPALPLGCPASPWFEYRALGQFSNQIRSEFSFVYEPSTKLSAVAGTELTKSSNGLQDQVGTGPGGVTLFTIPPEQIEHTDLALYAQASYRLQKALKLVVAGRLSYNEINNKPSASGFGTLFSPRLAVIYAPGRLVLKAIYSEAFKDPADFQKFGVLPLVYDFPSGGLRPERVANFEVGAGWQQGETLALEASAYQANYKDIVALRHIAGCDRPLGCNKLENHDQFRIRGLQATVRFRAGWAELWGNYTYTKPIQTNPDDGAGGSLFDAQGRRIDTLRIGDIASDHVNFGFSRDWSSRLTSDVRIGYVGPRRTGSGTTVASNPLEQVHSATLANATLSYKGPLPGTVLQLIVNNILDKEYFDPGKDTDSIGVPQVPQRRRAIYFRIVIGLNKTFKDASPRG